MVDEDVLVADRREAIAAMFADAFREARVERREFEVGPVLVDQAGKVRHAEEAAGFGDDRVGRVEPVLDARATSPSAMPGSSSSRTTRPRRRRLIAVRK